jgi:transposase
MDKKNSRIYLEIQSHRKNPYGVLRTSYRENGKVKHKNFGRLTGIGMDKLKLLRAAFQDEAIAKGDPNALKLLNSKEYGASAAGIKLARNLGLHQAIYSKPEEQWVKDSLAMIVGRLIYQGSKLSLSQIHEQSCLWELSGIKGHVDVETHCYDVMDKLYKRKDIIEKNLADKHLEKGCVVLYDISSSYMEGEYAESELVQYGYSRDRKRGYAQIVVGLVTNNEGCPIGVEVFPGNTKDSSTVIPKIKDIKEKYGIEDIVFVGDRGMTVGQKFTEIQSEGVSVISALSHQQMQDLLKRDVIQLGMFDKQNIVEVYDPEREGIRYCLCQNPDTAAREAKTRNALIEKTKEELDKIQLSTRKGSDTKMAARVGKALSKYKAGKYFDWEVKDKTLTYSLREDMIQKETSLDGCYIIVTDVNEKIMLKQEVVEAYKQLAFVETAFRNLKTVQLEIRPVYHKNDNRIKAHVFICMLAYYLQWHFRRRLSSLLDKDGKGKNRKWTFHHIIETLKAIRSQRVLLNNIPFNQITELTENQLNIITLLNIKI